MPARRARFTVAAGLDETIAAEFCVPLVDEMTESIRADVEERGPIQEGVLRASVYRTPTRLVGAKAVGSTVSTRPTYSVGQGLVDVAVYVEFGTRHMSPRRYMAAASQRSIALHGHGRFTRSEQP